jgi:hypothetical protein
LRIELGASLILGMPSSTELHLQPVQLLLLKEPLIFSSLCPALVLSLLNVVIQASVHSIKKINDQFQCLHESSQQLQLIVLYIVENILSITKSFMKVLLWLSLKHSFYTPVFSSFTTFISTLKKFVLSPLRTVIVYS